MVRGEILGLSATMTIGGGDSEIGGGDSVNRRQRKRESEPTTARISG